MCAVCGLFFCDVLCCLWLFRLMFVGLGLFVIVCCLFVGAVAVVCCGCVFVGCYLLLVDCCRSLGV